MTLGKMWFGTEESMRWIDAPAPGPDMSPNGWGTSGTLLNGGGYAFGSYGSHRVYQFSWSGASSIESAALMQGYASGTFGRGLLYFHDPLTYRHNILPKHVADPSLAIDGEAPSLVVDQDLWPTPAAPTHSPALGLPVRAAHYDLDSVEPGYRGTFDSLFIPVPPGMTLYLGGFYASTGSGGVFTAPVDADGVVGTPSRLTPNGTSSTWSTVVAPNAVTAGARGVRLWIGKTDNEAATVTLTALIARLVDTLAIPAGDPYGEGVYGEGIYGGATAPQIVTSPKWTIGLGHSGCRPQGHPTYLPTGPAFGGQAAYAITLRETGAWER